MNAYFGSIEEIDGNRGEFTLRLCEVETDVVLRFTRDFLPELVRIYQVQELICTQKDVDGFAYNLFCCRRGGL